MRFHELIFFRWLAQPSNLQRGSSDLLISSEFKGF